MRRCHVPQRSSSTGTTSTWTIAPSRSRPTGTRRPTISPTMTRCRSPTPSIGRPSSSTMTSPARTPRGGCGTAFEQLDDLETPPAPEALRENRPQRPRPADDAEERPTDAAVVHEGADDRPGRGVDRHGQPEPDSRDGGVDPDHPAPPVGERAARVARVERGVGLDDVFDEAARPTVARRERASERADDAGRHAAGEPERVADRDDELADPKPIRVAERGRRSGRHRSPGRRRGRTAGRGRPRRSRAPSRRRMSPSRPAPPRRRGPTSGGTRPA